MVTMMRVSVALVALTLPAHATVLTNTYTSYYAFGDSLTDDGKLVQLNDPSLGGRFSNGPTYAEILAEEFTGAGLDTQNYALGGATANDVNLDPLGQLSTFAGQLGVFSSAVRAGAVLPGSNPLVSVFFGANDFFQGRDPIQAADDVVDRIADIASISPEFDNFLVLGLPDIGATPAFPDGAASQAATKASDDFNTQLAAGLAALGNSQGLSITPFDTNGVFQEIVESVDNGTFEFGIFDVTTPCTASFSLPGPSCLDAGVDPNTLLFGDGVHPNAVAHEVLADAIVDAFEAQLSVVPLPASLPMLLGAVGFLGWRARRSSQNG